MPVEMNPTSVIVARLKIEEGGPTHAFFTAAVAKAMDKYVPWNTGALAQTAVKNGVPTENVTTNTITYAQHYAIVVYNGIRNGKELNYQLDTHANAGPYWDKRMWSAEGEKIIEQVQKFVERGGKK